MSGRGGGILQILGTLVSAISRAASRSRTASPPRATGGGSWLRGDAPAGHDAGGRSPGRFGDDATRELTRAEIRELRLSYGPSPDGNPDPGEIVWTWVPYAENDGRGKDRPVLIIARIDATSTACCYLSTKQRAGFVSVGTGGWDSQGRGSFLAPDRVLRITDAGMRREGHVLSQERFARAAEAVARLHGIDG